MIIFLIDWFDDWIDLFIYFWIYCLIFLFCLQSSESPPLLDWNWWHWAGCCLLDLTFHHHIPDHVLENSVVHSSTSGFAHVHVRSIEDRMEVSLNVFGPLLDLLGLNSNSKELNSNSFGLNLDSMGLNFNSFALNFNFLIIA